MKSILVISVLFLLLTSCTKNSITYNNANQDEGWIVPLSKLTIYKNAHDKIVAIDSPIYKNKSEVSIAATEEVFVVRDSNIIKIYPLPILWAHEIVNDKDYSVTFCPLTGTGVSFNNKINNQSTSFGVSGNLYNQNLIPYDRQTKSYWSQMTLQSIKGTMKECFLQSKNIFRTSYSTAIEAFPNANVLFGTTLLNLCDSLCNPNNTQTLAYTNSNSSFSIIEENTALLFKNYLFNNDISIIQTIFKGKKIAVIGTKKFNFITAFYIPQSTVLTAIQNQLPNIMQDQNGNVYDILGQITNGNNKGNSLNSPLSYSANNFVWDLFFSVTIF